ncbi:DUF3027 domain-containing protein [Actinomyces weissii]|uniref:DUF3027 domain-containing protein n=1 Tax=Actinomyces weissii TaxID=675090 RepID=UPI001F45A7EC|nr:DUF3027 domain-containing protein [Actinomyces weissii]
MTDTATQKPTSDARTPGIERPGSLPTPAERAAAAKDKTLTSAAAVELARQALGEITEPLSVGLFAASKGSQERLVTHLFECNLSGYRGWRWAVTMTRPPRGRTATICEMELLPGEEALLAPAWVPWEDRLQPGDVSRSDRLPRRETDERLEPGWEATGEDADAVALDVLDLGRPRVLSAEGIQRAAQRWYDGEHGPEAEGVRKAHATCSTCGFFLPMSGPMRNVFGVCANEWAADDGTVVSLDHGCGAHSETDLPDQGPEWPVTPSRLDEAALEAVATDGLDLRAGVTLEEQQAAERDAAAAQESSVPQVADQREADGATASEPREDPAAAPAPANAPEQEEAGEQVGDGAPASSAPTKPKGGAKARRVTRSRSAARTKTAAPAASTQEEPPAEAASEQEPAAPRPARGRRRGQGGGAPATSPQAQVEDQVEDRSEAGAEAPEASAPPVQEPQTADTSQDAVAVVAPEPAADQPVAQTGADAASPATAEPQEHPRLLLELPQAVADAAQARRRASDPEAAAKALADLESSLPTR